MSGEVEPSSLAANSGVEQDAPTSNLLDQMGGLSGLVASTLPVLVLVPVNSFYGLVPAISAALAVAVAVFVWRLARKETLQPAISGLVAVLISAGIAWYMGEARGFFLYGIWYSAVAGALFLISMPIGWPAVGVIWRGIKSEGWQWRSEPRQSRPFQLATLVWAAVFILRFAVQWRLYNADETAMLGIARIVMGWPLTGLALIATVWAVRSADRAAQNDVEE